MHCHHNACTKAHDSWPWDGAAFCQSEPDGKGHTPPGLQPLWRLGQGYKERCGMLPCTTLSEAPS